MSFDPSGIMEICHNLVQNEVGCHLCSFYYATIAYHVGLNALLVAARQNVQRLRKKDFYCVNISYLVDQCICPARSRSRQTLDKNVLSWALTGTGSVIHIRQVS